METKDLTTNIIAICDDEPKYIEQCISMCQVYFIKHNKNVEFLTFSSAEELMAYDKPIHIIFLDIELPGLSGIDAKNMLEKTRPNSAIVFMTNYESYMPQAFGKNVYFFLKKPLKFKEILKIVTHIFKEMILNEDYIIIDHKRVFLSQVMYIKAEDKYVRFVIYAQNSIIIRGTMNEWAENLKDKNFYRVQKSYIVNFTWIQSIERKIHLKDREYIPISRHTKKDFESAYHTFLMNMSY